MARVLVKEIVDTRKNYLVNGNFDFFQRGTTTTAGTTAVYSCDRWRLRTGTGGTTQRIQRLSSTPPAGSSFYSRIDGTVGNETCEFDQALESSLVDKLKGKSVTFSIKARRSSGFTPDLLIRIYKNSTANTSSSGTWNLLESVTISNSSLSSGTTINDWNTFSVTASIPNDGTANGIRIFVAVTAPQPLGSYFELAQAMLNEGSTPAPFKLFGGNIEGELAACRRYYEKSYPVDQNPGTAENSAWSGVWTPNNGSGSGSNVGIGTRFSVPKRSSPAMFIFDGAGNGGAVGSFRIGVRTNTSGQTNNIVPTSVTQTSTGVFVYHNVGTANAGLEFQWAADAEL